MDKLKHHIHLIPLIIILALATLFGLVSTIKILAETTANCTVQCTDWSDCSPNGTQTKTCHPYPTTCPGETTTESRTCNFDPPTCTSFTYSAWSSCQSNGKQTRQVTSKSPSGCTGGNSETERSCDYFTCTTKCGDWSNCASSGTQTKTCHPYPTTCPGETVTESRTCIYNAPPCNYAYTNWGPCTKTGVQYREIKSYSPEGCNGGSAETLKRDCAYTGSQNSTTNTASENTQSDITNGQSAQTENITSVQTAGPEDPSWAVNNDWKRKNFGADNCPEEKCAGFADPDKDRLTNNDEVRYGTGPLNPDTDGDGKQDGDEVANGTDPLKPAPLGAEDKIIYENPKELGEIKKDIYKVTNIEAVDTGKEEKELRISGKGPANSYVAVFIYSGQPIIVTVKTDSNGDWTYTIDKELADGDHEIYVAVTNNSGAIKAKSEPLPFVKTAQAITVTPTADSIQPTTKAAPAISIKKLLYTLAFSLFAAVAAILLIGRAINKAGGQKESDTVQ